MYLSEDKFFDGLYSCIYDKETMENAKNIVIDRIGFDKLLDKYFQSIRRN
jgi:hypothetical protein